MIYTYQQLVQLAQANGFSGASAYIIAAVAMAESGGNTQASNVNTDGSIDRGLLQINNVYHPEVSDSCAGDATCSMQQAYRISNYGSNFSPWAAYNNGSYQQYIGGTANSGVQSSTSVAMNNTSTTSFDLSSLSGLFSFAGDPVRIVKVIIGMGFILLAILLIAQPDILNKATEKVGTTLWKKD
jgi:hypothetical protein